VSTLRRSDGDAGSRAGATVDTAAVLGVQQMRPSFLDDVRRSGRSEARHTAARHAWSNHAGAHRAETGCSRGGGRSYRHSRRPNHPYGPAPLTATRTMLPRFSFPLFSSPDDDDLEDDDLEDDDEEVEEDEEDEGEEEVWQVRLT
jgi:hypothetical protein